MELFVRHYVVKFAALAFGIVVGNGASGCGSVTSPADPDAQTDETADAASPQADASLPVCNPKVVFSMASDIHRVDADGTGLMNLTNRATDNQSLPRVSPDGALIAYTSTQIGTSNIFVMDLDGGNPQQVSLSPVENAGFAAWAAPNRIAFTATVQGVATADIVVANLDGSGRQIVTSDAVFSSSLFSSPIAGKLMYSETAESGAFPLKLINVDGTSPLIISEAAGHRRFSPDGSQVVYTRSSIFTINVDGTERTELTANASELDFFPSWTSDALRIYFRRNLGSGENAQTDIFVMNADGSGQTNITNSAESESEPFLSPDGEVLVFTTPLGLTLANPDGTNPQLVAGTQGASAPQWTPCQ